MGVWKLGLKQKLKLDHKLTTRHLLDFLRDLFRARILFVEQKKCFSENKYPDFTVIDEITEKYCYPLKENCHHLFRNGRKTNKELTARELLDFLISAIFHEMLKLKESVYIISYYRPILEKLEKESKTQIHDPLIHVSTRMILETEASLPKTIDEIEGFWLEIFKFLPEVLKEYSDNMVLSRYLIKHKDEIEKVYGKDEWTTLINSVYPEGLCSVLLKTSISYAKSFHHNEAFELTQMAIEQINTNSKINKELKPYLKEMLEIFSSIKPKNVEEKKLVEELIDEISTIKGIKRKPKQ